jgi:hypothetical protein
MTNNKRTAALKASTATVGHNLPKTLDASIEHAGALAEEARTTRDKSNTLMLDMALEFVHGIVAFCDSKYTVEVADRYMAKCFPDQKAKIGDKANPSYSEKRSKLASFAFPAVLAAKPDYADVVKLPGEKWVNCYKVNLAIRDKAKANGEKAAPVKVTAALVTAATAKAQSEAAERTAEIKAARAKMSVADKASEAVALLRNAVAALGNAKVRTSAIDTLELSKPVAAALGKLIDALTA